MPSAVNKMLHMPDTLSNGSEASQKVIPPLLGVITYTQLLLQVVVRGKRKGFERWDLSGFSCHESPWEWHRHTPSYKLSAEMIRHYFVLKMHKQISTYQVQGLGAPCCCWAPENNEPQTCLSLFFCPWNPVWCPTTSNKSPAEVSAFRYFPLVKRALFIIRWCIWDVWNVSTPLLN